MLGSIKVGEEGAKTTYVCAHWRTFPPKGYQEDIEEQRASKSISTHEYQMLQVWQRICGLFKMDADKCLGCPHVLRVKMTSTGPKTVDVNGVERFIVDIPTRESAPTNRSYLTVAIEKTKTPNARKKTP